MALLESWRLIDRMHFDIATALLLTSLLTFAVSASLAFATSRYPAQMRTTARIWIGGLLLQVTALFVMALFGSALSASVIVLLNVAFALSYFEMGRAVSVFAQQPRSRLSFLPVLAVAVISFLFAVVWPQPDLRIALCELPFALLLYDVARAILRERRALRPPDYLTGALFLACAVLALMRGAFEFLGAEVVARDTLVTMANIVFVSGAVLPMLGTIGFILMGVDRLNDDLTRLAMVDPLTGVYNRRTLAGLAQTAIANAARARTPLSLLAIDVDHFKRINDDFGHDSGDEALRHLVAFMKESLHPQHVLCRIGGEEFAILLPGADEQEACLTAERVRQHIAASAFSVHGHTFRLHVSIGVATVDGETRDLAALLRVADHALYAAKRAGRNRVATQSSQRPADAGQDVAPVER